MNVAMALSVGYNTIKFESYFIYVIGLVWSPKENENLILRIANRPSTRDKLSKDYNSPCVYTICPSRLTRTEWLRTTERYRYKPGVKISKL